MLRQTVLLGRTKVQLDCGLLAALLPEAQLSLCASEPVLCGSRVTEHSQRPRCPVDGSWPRRPVTPRATCGTAGNGRRGVWEEQQQQEEEEGEHLHNSDGREEKLENSRDDGKQQRTECSVVVVKVCTGLAGSVPCDKRSQSRRWVSGRVDGWIDGRICPTLEKSRAKEKGPCWSCQLSRPALPRLCCAVACRSVGLGNLVPVRASPNPGSPQSAK